MDLVQISVGYPGGGSVAAILLGVSGNTLRLALQGWDDAGEFRLVGGQWYSEQGEPVEIDSVLEPVDHGEVDPFWPGPYLGPVPASVVWMN